MIDFSKEIRFPPLLIFFHFLTLTSLFLFNLYFGEVRLICVSLLVETQVFSESGVGWGHHANHVIVFIIYQNCFFAEEVLKISVRYHRRLLPSKFCCAGSQIMKLDLICVWSTNFILLHSLSIKNFSLKIAIGLGGLLKERHTSPLASLVINSLDTSIKRWINFTPDQILDLHPTFCYWYAVI